MFNLGDARKVIFSHPTGNQNSRQAAVALCESGLLSEFWTCVAPNASLLGRLLQRLPGGGELRRRNIPCELLNHVHQQPLREVIRLVASRLGWNWLTRHEEGFASIDSVYRSLDCRVANRISGLCNKVRGVYAYEDGALESFRVARELRIRTVYDLPIGYWRVAREIAEEESERLPEWKGTLPALSDSSEKLRRKDEELELADCVIVASSFTASTLAKAPLGSKVPVVIPYGCSSPTEIPANVSKLKEARKPTAPLRILFVGSLSQRKGIYELFRAVEALGDRASLTIVGGRVGGSAIRDQYLERHRWFPTAPHEQVLKLMREHDVLVFPSLFEGFGLVITEALSQGLPVITTSSTGGPDILTDGEDGYLVPVRDWEAIATKLELLDNDRDRLGEMKVKALRTASLNSWASYRQRVSVTVSAALKPIDVCDVYECLQ